MVEINLLPAPAQRFAVVLGGQPCVIQVYVKDSNTYLDLDVNDTAVVRGAICHDRQNVVRYQTPFTGGLIFIDTDGREDPRYTGFGSRWRFCYLTDEEMRAL